MPRSPGFALGVGLGGGSTDEVRVVGAAHFNLHLDSCRRAACRRLECPRQRTDSPQPQRMLQVLKLPQLALPALPAGWC